MGPVVVVPAGTLGLGTEFVNNAGFGGSSPTKARPSANSFVRAFTLWTGTSPAAYRAVADREAIKTFVRI